MKDFASAGGATATGLAGAADRGIPVEAHFRFADRAAFEAYERDGAPRLRAEGLELFPPEAGVTYRRRTGEVAVRGG